MKIFKQIVIAAIAIYLLSVVACRKDKVEVIPGGSNPVGSIEDAGKPGKTNYPVNGLAGFSRFSFMCP